VTSIGMYQALTVQHLGLWEGIHLGAHASLKRCDLPVLAARARWVGLIVICDAFVSPLT
jgi:hypothetical protein